MAKKFLDTLGDAFEDDMLQDVIPMRKGKPVTRKKSFLADIKSRAKTSSQKNASSPIQETKKRRKSFLESIEEALENNAFDDIIPDNPSWKKNRASSTSNPTKLETRLSTSIPTNVLDRAKEIARLKKLNLKDVINIALQYYVENNGKV